MTTAEKKAYVANLRPIDDTFFEVLVQDKDVCEEILRIILENPELVVAEVISQSSVQNIYGRSVRLDALCTTKDGAKINVEVQRADNDDHLRRVRYNASSITVKDSQPGSRFKDVLDVYVIYISEFDIFGEGKTVYHIDKVLRETGTKVEDGLYEIFVNTKNDDGSRIAALMKCFLRKEVNDERFPKLSQRVKELKETEGGLNAMCEATKKIVDDSIFDVLTYLKSVGDSYQSELTRLLEDKEYRNSCLSKYHGESPEK